MITFDGDFKKVSETLQRGIDNRRKKDELIAAADELIDAAGEYILNLVEGDFVSATRENRYSIALKTYNNLKDKL